jgi:hypothetical protein
MKQALRRGEAEEEERVDEAPEETEGVRRGDAVDPGGTAEKEGIREGEVKGRPVGGTCSGPAGATGGEATAGGEETSAVGGETAATAAGFGAVNGGEAGGAPWAVAAALTI